MAWCGSKLLESHQQPGGPRHPKLVHGRYKESQQLTFWVLWTTKAPSYENVSILNPFYHIYLIPKQHDSHHSFSLILMPDCFLPCSQSLCTALAYSLVFFAMILLLKAALVLNPSFNFKSHTLFPAATWKMKRWKNTRQGRKKHLSNAAPALAKSSRL